KARSMAALRPCGKIYRGAASGSRSKKKPADEAVIIRHLKALMMEGLAMKVQKAVEVISCLYAYSITFCLANGSAVPIAHTRQNRPQIGRQEVRRVKQNQTSAPSAGERNSSLETTLGVAIAQNLELTA